MVDDGQDDAVGAHGADVWPALQCEEVAVNVQAEVVSLRELAERDDVILVAVWEVNARSDQLSMIS